MKRFAVLLLFSIFFYSCSKNDNEVTGDPNDITVIAYAPVDISKSFTTPVLAHYMPWFESPEFAEFGQSNFSNWGLHWTMANKNPELTDANGKREIASHYYPLIEPYDNGEPHYLEYAVVCMKLAGLDGIIIDYAGITEVYDWKLLHDHTEAIIPWLQAAGLSFAIMYEDKSLENALNQNVITDTVAEAKRVMEYIEDNFFAKSHYLKLNQKPVLFTFGPQALLTDSSWVEVFSDVQDLNFITLPYNISNLNLNNSAHGEFAWVSSALSDNFYTHCSQYAICVGSGMPGFNDFYYEGGWGNGFPFHDDLNGLLFTQTLQRAANHSTDLIQIVTWNDFGEGTMVEPTQEFEYARLNQIQNFLGVSYGELELAMAVELYNKRKEHKNKVLENKKLDQLFYYLISLQLGKARRLLDEV